MEFCIESCTKEYKQRFLRHYEELKWLYLELYQNREDMLQSLCRSMYGFYEGRNASLKSIDCERLENPE